jgi:hypothetical protein
MIVDQARRPPERRERLMIMHQAQHAVKANRQTQA